MFRRVITLGLQCVWMLLGQTDPGPQQGQPDAGRPLPGLTQLENGAFQQGQQRFRQLVSVTGTQSGAPRRGLGPRFNLNSCAGCHAQPGPGGSSPSTASHQVSLQNPQIEMATALGAQNTVPPFIQANGPIRVARFVLSPTGYPDGNVQPLFVISGRSDAGTCAISQPDFTTAMGQNNVVFRIPTPTFGAGLIEAIADETLVANLAANATLKTAFGIAGRPNRSPNDGSVTRFGWKAQTRSLEQFSAEAYNVEMGVTNPLYRSESDTSPNCVLNALPEDQTNFAATSPTAGLSDIAAFAEFMRWLAPPTPAQNGPGPNGAPPNNNLSAARGQVIFTQIGCSLCHTPSLQTANTTSQALANKTVGLYSDLAIHHMGAGLSDGLTQGLATGDEFRTAPLWGLAQRIYLLHDGRTTDLLQAIQGHASSGSEGNGSIAAFGSLTPQSMQDLLNFLRSL